MGAIDLGIGGTAERDIGPRVTFFLGAGASLGAPASAALFGEIRRALVERTAGTRGPARPEARLLLDHVLPEVLLKEFTDAGYDLYAALSRAIGFPDGAQAPDANRIRSMSSQAMYSPRTGASGQRTGTASSRAPTTRSATANRVAQSMADRSTRRRA